MTSEHEFSPDWHDKWREWYQKRVMQEMCENYAESGYAVTDAVVGKEITLEDLYGEISSNSGMPLGREREGRRRKDMKGWKPSRVPETLREMVEEAS